MSSALFERLAPLAFVALWSTGWIVARYSADYADPLTFLCLRFALAGALVAAVAFVARARFPATRKAWGHALVSGILLHGVYLGLVWWVIRQGLPASISALIAASQPLMTVWLAPRLLGEAGSARRWTGVAIGFCGLLLVLWPKLVAIDGTAATPALIGINLLGMAAASAGFFYQKRFLPDGDLSAVTAIQYLGALIVVAPAAWLLEPMRIEWNLTMALVLAWSAVALSIGAIGLLLILIRHGEVSRASQLIFLVPPVAALQAWVLFNERLQALQICGMILTAAGVALASRVRPKET